MVRILSNGEIVADDDPRAQQASRRQNTETNSGQVTQNSYYKFIAAIFECLRVSQTTFIIQLYLPIQLKINYKGKKFFFSKAYFRSEYVLKMHKNS